MNINSVAETVGCNKACATPKRKMSPCIAVLAESEIFLLHEQLLELALNPLLAAALKKASEFTCTKALLLTNAH